MKLSILLLIISLCGTGCEPEKMPPSWVKNASWHDTSIGYRFPSYVFSCDSDGKIVGNVDNYGGTWTSSVGGERNAYLDKQRAMDAVQVGVDAKGLCR